MTNLIATGVSVDAAIVENFDDLAKMTQRQLIISLGQMLFDQGCIKIVDRGVINGRREFAAGVLCDKFPEALEFP